MPNRKILKMSLAANTNVTIFVSTNVSNALPLLSYNGGPRVPLLDALGDSGAKRKLGPQTIPSSRVKALLERGSGTSLPTLHLPRLPSC